MKDWHKTDRPRRDRALTELDILINSMDPRDTIIISGGADGIDTSAYTMAQAQGFEAYEIRAPWYLGRGAGHLRNPFMVRIADDVYALWDGVSSGTHGTIGHARRAEKLRRVIEI